MYENKLGVMSSSCSTPITSSLSPPITNILGTSALSQVVEEPELSSPLVKNLMFPVGATTTDSNKQQGFNCHTNKSNCATTMAQIQHQSRFDSDSSEMCSQTGDGDDSTSPESLIDNILSAASSCDSTNSLSSAATDVTRLGINIALNTVENCYVGITNSCMATSNQTTKLLESTSNFEKAMFTKSSLKLKSKSSELLQVSPCPLLPPTLSSPRAVVKLSTPVLVTRLNESQSSLQPTEILDIASSLRSRSPSPGTNPSAHTIAEHSLYPDDLKCQICNEPFQDPRTLNCLHSFCFQCLINENFKQDQSIPFWSQPNETSSAAVIANEDANWKFSPKSNQSFRSLSPETTVRSASENGTCPQRQRRSSFSFRRKKSQDAIHLKAKFDGGVSENSSMVRLSTFPNEVEKELERDADNIHSIVCKICNFATELLIGGLRQLPQNFILIRKIEEIKLKVGDEVISRVFCGLCCEETNATYHCVTCTMNLCSLCKEAHERQKPTASHKIKNIMELRRARKKQQTMLENTSKFTLKCGMHPGFEIKSFCTVCLQVACTDCLILLHKGHKHETVQKAIVNYAKILNVASEQTRPLCGYAEHSKERLSDIAKGINNKCDNVQESVEAFMQQYFQALEVHHKTLLQQVNRARESKIEMILEHQMDLEKRSTETQEAVSFCQDLRELGSDVEVLAFVNILLKRFEYCQQFKAPVDPKISDSLHFLPQIVAPSTKEQNGITLYGIITMQTVEPANCTLQTEEFSQLRLHKRVELSILTRDTDGVAMCHGGVINYIQTQLKYKESSSKTLPIELSDNRDGTYFLAFTPDSPGTILLTITINEKPIKGSPFAFLARAVRPHSGIYHCCAFCSSGKVKGSKSIKCSCEGRMPGYNGCGHGHIGHPGRRHWSCCGNVLENSECSVANKQLNS